MITKTGYESKNNDDLDLIVGCSTIAGIISLFLFLIFAAIAIRTDNYLFLIADLVMAFLSATAVRVIFHKKDKLGRFHKRATVGIVIDGTIWVTMAVITGFSWTLITYTLYLLVSWPSTIVLIPSIIERKRREKAKETDTTV